MTKTSVSLAEFQGYLKGVHYPASRDEVYWQAQDNQAPENLLTFIDNLPAVDFQSPVEVREACGNILLDGNSPSGEQQQSQTEEIGFLQDIPQEEIEENRRVVATTRR